MWIAIFLREPDVLARRGVFPEQKEKAVILVTL
jgi:hypothetical protein